MNAIKLKTLYRIILCVGLIWSPTAYSQSSTNAYTQAVLADDPLVYYSFDESSGAGTAADSSGNGNDGIYNNVSLGNAGPTTVLGTAAGFDGSGSNYVAVPYLGSAASYTFEAWLKPNDYNYNGLAMVYGNFPWQTGAINYQLYGNLIRFSVNGGGPSDFSSPSFIADQWVYVVITYDGDSKNFHMYVNGQLSYEESINSVSADFEPAEVGNWSGDNGRGFNGLIDGFAIYASALSADQVQAHYVAAGGPPFATVTIQPQDATVFAGQTTTLTVGATVVGTNEPPSYQWQVNGVDIVGATNATYTTPTLTLADDGTTYACLVSVPVTGALSAITRNAILSVAPATPYSSAAYTNAVLADHPVVYYRFEENPGATNVVDSSGNGNDGTYNNVTLGNPSATAIGSSVDFTNINTSYNGYTNGTFNEGSSSYVSVPALGGAVSLGGDGNDQLTIECWIKPQKFTADEALYAINQNYFGVQFLWGWYADPTDIHFALDGNTPTSVDFFNPAISSGKWTYVALVYDDATSSAILYVNGALVSTNFYTSAGPMNLDTAQIGLQNDGQNPPYCGQMDEFAIYTNALSADRIQVHYMAGATPPLAITNQPQDITVFAGQTATFTVGAAVTGTDELPSYQWQSNGVDIAGATNAAYTTPTLTLADNGTTFDCLVSLPGFEAFSTTTRNAILSVAPATPYSSAAYTNAVLADHPVVYYRFEENPGATNVVDSSGNGNDGTYNNVMLGNPSATAIGRSVEFTNVNTSYSGYNNGTFNEGSSSYVSVPALGDAISLGGDGNDQLTIECWIKPQKFTADEALYTIDQNNFGVQLLWGWFADPTDIHFGLDGNDPASVDFFSPAIAVGQWTYMVLIYDDATSSAILYVNGASVSTNVYTSAGPMNLDAAQIGLENDGQNPPYYGLMDEFAIYTNALSADRIQAHYVAGVTAPQPPALSISKSDNQVTISWSGTGFILQETTNLLNNAGWEDVLNATNSPATAPIGNSSMFYRLRSQ